VELLRPEVYKYAAEIIRSKWKLFYRRGKQNRNNKIGCKLTEDGTFLKGDYGLNSKRLEDIWVQ
jgi:hypothetical protein